MIQPFQIMTATSSPRRKEKLIWYLGGLKGYVGSIFNGTLNQHLKNTSAFFPAPCSPLFPLIRWKLQLRSRSVWGRAFPGCLAGSEQIKVQTWLQTFPPLMWHGRSLIRECLWLLGLIEGCSELWGRAVRSHSWGALGREWAASGLSSHVREG